MYFKNIANFNYGQRIAALRERRGMTKAELAIKAGLSPSLITKIEKGENKPSLDSLEALCNVLGISVKEFFVYSDNPHKSMLYALIENMTDEQAHKALEIIRHLIRRGNL